MNYLSCVVFVGHYLRAFSCLLRQTEAAIWVFLHPTNINNDNDNKNKQQVKKEEKDISDFKSH